MLALGRLEARRDGIEPGFLSRLGSAAIIPELIETTKKPCYKEKENTNTKYQSLFKARRISNGMN